MSPKVRLPDLGAAEAEEGTDALAEATALATGTDLSDRRALNRINKLFRADQVNAHLHRLRVWGLYVAACAIAGMFICVCWNQAAPTSWRFLRSEERRVGKE